MANRRGFLLLEVIVSIVVVTAGLLFVVRAYSTSKQAIDRSGRMFMQSLLLENRMFYIEEPGEMEQGRTQGDFGSLKEYQWSASIEPVEGYDLNKVTLDVTHTRSGRISTESLVTLVRNKKVQ